MPRSRVSSPSSPASDGPAAQAPAPSQSSQDANATVGASSVSSDALRAANTTETIFTSGASTDLNTVAMALPSTSRFAPFEECYDDMNELRRALKVVSVQHNAPYYMQHSSPQRVEARCPTWRQRKKRKAVEPDAPVCDFVVSANKHANGRVYVTRAVVTHSPTCAVMRARLAANVGADSETAEGVTGRATSVSAAALLETAKPFMGQLASALGGGDAVKPKDMANIMKEKFGVQASYMTAWRALSAFKQQRKVEDAASFMKLQGYLTAFAAANPGSLVAFEHQDAKATPPSGKAESKKVFARAFLCPKPLQDALRYCRGALLLSIFLVTSPFGGVVLTATAQDAMGDNVPIAIALVPAETEHDWRYFLQHLRRAFPEMERSVTSLVHNRGDELTRAAHAVFPKCVQSNEVETFIRNPEQSASPDAAAGSVGVEPIGGVSLPVASSLEWLESLCNKAPLMILVGWVSQVARTLFRRYERYGHLSSEYPTEFHALSAQYEAEASRFDVVRIAESGFEVIDKQSGRPRVVDFAKQTCSCGEYDASRFPCLHVFLAVSYAGMVRTDVIPRIFLMTSLKSLYGGRVTPIDIDTVAPDGVTVPQTLPKTRGRPRKVQQIQQFGDTKQEKLSCSVCGVKGHNKRTCKRVTPVPVATVHGGNVNEMPSGEEMNGQEDTTFLVSPYGEAISFDNSALGTSSHTNAGAEEQSLQLSAKRRRQGVDTEAEKSNDDDNDSDNGVALV